MAHAVLIPAAIAAMNVDSYNRSVLSASAIDNGNLLTMGAEFTSGSLTEVFAVTAPASGSKSAGLWMAYSGDEIVITDARYKGLDPDPRNFFNPAGKVFSAFKLQVGDIIIVTADAFTGARSSEGYAVPTAAYGLLWSTGGDGGGVTFKYIGTTYISLATGSIDSQHVTAYKLECVGI